MNRHRARRRFGQHFLENELILEQMVGALAPAPGDRVLEIGPGLGALTRLLAEAVDTLAAVEIDRDVAALLRGRFANLELTIGDILRVDLGELLGEHCDWRIIGNLPYNISTPLLVRLFAVLGQIRDVHVLLQSEVVDRLIAVPGTKAWGRLSIAAQLHCQVDALFDVAPENFRPAPKVNSTFVRLLPQPSEVLPEDPQVFDEVVRLAFQQRRKTLRNALRSLEIDWDRVAVDPGDRADAVGIEGYVLIADSMVAKRRVTDEHGTEH